MLRKTKFCRLTALLLAVCLLCAVLPVSSAAGSTVTWRLEGDTLIYSGTGMVRTQDLAPESVRNQVKHVIVEPGITRVPNGFMKDSKSLETVTLPEGLTTIQMFTFSGCTNLKSLNIPSTVTELQRYALSGLTSLESIELPEGLESLGEDAFSGCKSLKRVTIPGGIVDIPSSAFSNCTALEEVVISRGVRSIADAAFSHDSALKRVVIPDTVTSIGGSAFSACSGLEEITLPASLASLHQYSFYYCDNLKKITFLGTQEQWDAFDPLLLREGGLRDSAVYLSDKVECLGTGAHVTTKITFDANGGTVSQTQKEVAYGESYGALPTPVNSGKVFYGWYTQREGGTAVSSATEMNELKDHTLYAHWGLAASALTPAKAGEAYIPDRDPFDPHSTYMVTSTFSVAGGSNAFCEGRSHLYANEKGGLTRVQVASEYFKDLDAYGSDHLVITEMDSNFNIMAQGTVPMELGKWGGFYAAEMYNYLIFGQVNPKGASDCEVVRVVKYDKNWNRLGSGSVYGADIASPFVNGTGACTIDCAEYNGHLYIHMGRVMYNTHQSCATQVFRVADMENTYASSVMYAYSDDYVSHAYDQQILVDREGRLVSLDLGDGAPRALVLHQYQDADLAHGVLTAVGTAANNISNIRVKNYHVQEIAGGYGQLNTSCAVAGMVETEDYYLVVYQYNPKLEGRLTGDLLYQFVDKKTLTGKSVKLADAKVAGAKVVAVDNSSGYIIWTDAQHESKIYYAPYGNGTVGTVRQAEGYRGGSTPILYQGKLIWSVDMIECQSGNDIWQPQTGQYYKRFYTLDPSTGAVTHKDFMMIDTETAPGRFTDVSADAYYADAVAWAVKNNVTVGTGTNTFSPSQNCTEIQILTFLWRAARKPVANVTLPVSVTGADDYVSAAKWACSKGMIGADFRQDTPCTRAAAVKFMWQAAGSPAASGSSFTDVPANADYAQAVAWAVEKGVTQGAGDNTFGPDDICSRAQIATFLHRAYK